jgi:pimeloyl-ACP methyl ester carboxylesterase
MIVTSSDGVTIAYTVAGTGPPVVLLHGFTETGASWQEAGYVERFLAAGRRVVLIDCRGHGGSGKPHEAAAYSGDRWACDVVAVLDVLGIGAADLIGYSMGGMIALTTALRFPERVRRLVVIAAHPFAQDMAPYRLAVTDGMMRWLAMVERQGVRLSEDWRRRMLPTTSARSRPASGAIDTIRRQPLRPCKPPCWSLSAQRIRSLAPRALSPNGSRHVSWLWTLGPTSRRFSPSARS